MGKQQEALLKKKEQERRKAVPKMFLDGENRAVVFEEMPVVKFSPSGWLALQEYAVKNENGLIEVMLQAVEVVDGVARLHLVRKVEQK